MELWSGYIGLIISFVIISAIVLWFAIRTPGQIIIKALLIPATIWYGLILYYSVPNLMGWPISQSIPDNSHVLSVRINEPNPMYNDPGAIYVWIIVKSSSKSPEQKLAGLFNLKNAFSSNKKTQPCLAFDKDYCNNYDDVPKHSCQNPSRFKEFSPVIQPIVGGSNNCHCNQ